MPCAVLSGEGSTDILWGFIYTQPALIIANVALWTHFHTLIIIDSKGPSRTNDAVIGRVFTKGASLITFITSLILYIGIEAWAALTKTCGVPKSIGMVITLQTFLECWPSAVHTSEVTLITFKGVCGQPAVS